MSEWIHQILFSLLQVGDWWYLTSEWCDMGLLRTCVCLSGIRLTCPATVFCRNRGREREDDPGYDLDHHPSFCHPRHLRGRWVSALFCPFPNSHFSPYLPYPLFLSSLIRNSLIWFQITLKSIGPVAFLALRRPRLGWELGGILGKWGRLCPLMCSLLPLVATFQMYTGCPGTRE